MTMRALALILGLGLELAMAAAPVRAVQDEDGQVRVRTGIACDRSSGAPLYREIHKERWVEGRLVEDRVSYHRPDGNEFAAKRVDYRASAIAPEFELADAASGHEEALQRIGDTLVVRYRASQDAPERSATLPATGGLIADAGFERFVLATLGPPRGGRSDGPAVPHPQPPRPRRHAPPPAAPGREMGKTPRSRSS